MQQRNEELQQKNVPGGFASGFTLRNHFPDDLLLQLGGERTCLARHRLRGRRVKYSAALRAEGPTLLHGGLIKQSEGKDSKGKSLDETWNRNSLLNCDIL